MEITPNELHVAELVGHQYPMKPLLIIFQGCYVKILQ